MKIPIIFPFFRTSDSTSDGPPLSTPLLVGNIKAGLPGHSLTQIDLNLELLTSVRRGLFPRKDYDEAIAHVAALVKKPGPKVSGYAGYRLVQSFTDNRVASDYCIPEESALPPVREFLKRLVKFAKLGAFDHYFLTVYKGNEPDIIASILLARYLKSRYPSKKIIFGGFRNFTPSLKEELHRLDFIDSLVIGLGENSMKEIIATLAAGKKLKKLYETPVEPKELLGLPDYGSFRNLDFFRISVNDLKKKYGIQFGHRNAKSVIFIPYSFAIGCFWGKCKYCGESVPDRLPFLSKTADEIVDDLEKLKKTCRTNFFIFYNNNFNTNLAFAKDLLRKMIARKLDILWTDSFNIINLDDELIELLAKAGCIRVDLGTTILAPKLQRLYSNLLRDNKHLANLPKLHRTGIWVDINLITNAPFDYSADEGIKALYRYLPYIDAATLNTYRACSSDIVNNASKYGLSVIDTAVGMGTGDAPMYFIEKEFRGKVKERLEMFRKNYLSWRFLLDKHDIINNRKHFYLLGLLYQEFGLKNKKKIRELMLQANMNV